MAEAGGFLKEAKVDSKSSSALDDRRRLLAERLCEEFKAFILEAMDDGFVNLDECIKKKHVMDILVSGMDIFYDMSDPEFGEEGI